MIALGSMPLLNDYSLCRDSVTVYHKDGGIVTRTVHAQAYIDFKKAQEVDRSGSAEDNEFFLLVPGSTPACEVGDKVVLGEGPQVPESGVAEWWRQFIPVKVANLGVVRYVDMKRWNGENVHTEAGG